MRLCSAIVTKVNDFVLLSFVWSTAELVVRYPKLSGLGFVALPVLRGAFREFVITMDFRPDSRHGLLLFSSDHPETRFDFFSVSLVDGRVDFR